MLTKKLQLLGDFVLEVPYIRALPLDPAGGLSFTPYYVRPNHEDRSTLLCRLVIFGHVICK